MARKQPNPRGSRKKLTRSKKVVIYDRETGEPLAYLRTKPGERDTVYVEPVEGHVASRVVPEQLTGDPPND